MRCSPQLKLIEDRMIHKAVLQQLRHDSQLHVYKIALSGISQSRVHKCDNIFGLLCFHKNKLEQPPKLEPVVSTALQL